MSHHHHHPHEGHSAGNPPKSKPIHHDWRFYAAGVLLLAALLAYLFSITPSNTTVRADESQPPPARVAPAP